jgi:hypothetical protein
MSLSSFAVLAGGTNSATGGTSKTYAIDGKPVVGGVHVADASVADFRVRPNATFRNREPKYNSALKKFSKDKKGVTLVIPKLLADGSTEYNLIRIEREVHPESTAAEALELNIQGAQLLFDSEVAAFWASGSLV